MAERGEIKWIGGLSAGQDVTIRVAQNGAIEETLAVVKVHSTVLSRHSKYFKTCMAERWGNPTSSQESSPNRSWEFVLEAQADVDCYLDCFARMNVTPHVKNANRVFHDVKYSLELLKVASQIEFDELMDSTALALSSVYWSEEDEIRIREYTSAPGFPRNHARDLIARLGLDNLDKTELEDRHKGLWLFMSQTFRTTMTMDDNRAFVAELLQRLDEPAIPYEVAAEVIKLFNSEAKNLLNFIENGLKGDSIDLGQKEIQALSWVLKASLLNANVAEVLVPIFAHLDEIPQSLHYKEYGPHPEHWYWKERGPSPNKSKTYFIYTPFSVKLAALGLAELVVLIYEEVIAGRLVLRMPERVALLHNWHPFLEKICGVPAEFLINEGQSGVELKLTDLKLVELETILDQATRQLFSTLSLNEQIKFINDSLRNVGAFISNQTSFTRRLLESLASH